MSGEHRRAEAPQGPPWSLELLADLHAGVLDQQTASQLRLRVRDDPEAAEVLAALDATSSQLAALPPLTIPDDVSARIDAALDGEIRAWAAQQNAAPTGAAGAQVIDFAAAKQRRRRRLTFGIGLAGVAAAAAAVVIAVLPGGGGQHPTAQAPSPGSSSATLPDSPVPDSDAPGSTQPLALQGSQVSLSGEQFSQVLHSDEYSAALSDPQRLIGCLQANGVSGGKPLGARQITLNGKPAQLLVLPGGTTIGKFRLLAVGPQCGPGNPDKISDSTFGG